MVWESLRERNREAGKDSDPIVPLIKARISNYNTSTPLKNLKTHLYGM